MADLPPIIGEDPVFLDAVDRASQLAVFDRPCLVLGERGTGKELFATRLHYLSPRWEGPLVKVNCAALSETLLDAELFGHEAGAFTGAQRRRIGRFERAQGGTLILDEIASASPAVQEKVLRVIEYGELERVGGEGTVTVDVRVIGAANVDLADKAREGSFRADLLDRLTFDVLTLPPLRARPGDLRPLAESFARDMAREAGRETAPTFSEAALNQMAAYPWPGNVRELRNAVERTVARLPRDRTVIGRVIVDPFESPWRLGGDIPFRDPRPEAPADLPADFDAAVADFECGLLTRALRESRYKQVRAAQALGLGYHRFRRLMAKYGLSSRAAGEERDRN